MKKLLSLVLSLLMVCALLPMGVFAEKFVLDNDFIVDDASDYALKDGDLILVGYIGNDRIVTVPSSIAGLTESAFSDPTSHLQGKDRAIEQIEQVILPEGLTNIAYEAFVGCHNLKKVNIPSTVRQIAQSAFSGTQIEEVILPKGLERVGESAFSDCNKIRKLVIPEGMRIMESGFCGTFYEITLPSTLEYIPEYAFYYCNNLKKLALAPDSDLVFKLQDGVTIYSEAGSVPQKNAQKNGQKFEVLALYRDELTLKTGDEYILHFNSHSPAVWKSNNSKVVSVDQNGKLTAKASGTATITATLYGKKYTCKVTVSAATYTVKRGDTLWCIASKQLGNGRRYTEIMKLNGLRSTKIVSGQKLKLPER